tara:strand:+ start:72 stop:956 length:885 start_codon:yes stop_codon:yes gene_type:complete
MNDDVINNDITILIVLYKESYELISKTLNPINSFKKIIIDNAGNQELKNKIQSNFNIEKYIVNKINSGFSEGYNQAIKLCETKYSLILGPDCIIEEKDINLLLKEFLQYKNCFLVSPTSYDENMSLTYAGGKLPDNDQKNEILKLSGNACVEATLGACMLVKTKEFIEIGCFDKNFFLYFSDDDICRRVKELKKSIIQIYAAKCIHQHGNIKVKNKYKKIFIREYNLTHDKLYYFYKVNKHDELIKVYKKKIPRYFFRVISKFFTFKLLEAVKFLSIILAYFIFIFKFQNKFKK